MNFNLRKIKYQKKEGKCKYKRNIVARSQNHCCRGKEIIIIIIIHFECNSVALVIQHA
jgi:hypothetical protein